MINTNNSEFPLGEFPSQNRLSFPFKNHKPNNISFKNSINIINSEKKPNNHRQYLIDFIRDNNNKNRKSPAPKQMISNKNKSKMLNSIDEENEEIIDKNNFFNDYFIQQIRLEKINFNKYNVDKLMDICDYIGEDSKRPINLEIMNINMHNFIPGRISSKSFGLINSYAANTNQGIDRNYNDDRVKIMINMNRPENYFKKSPWPLISFFGIFDGHNGDHCADFLRQNLLKYIYTNPNFPKNIEKSIKEAFIKADEDYLKNYLYTKDNKNMNMSINYNSDYYNNSGSCGLILLIVDTKIYVANVGDSRCIISCQNGKIQKDVTRDHKPEFPYEKKRIYDNGGSIYRNETLFNDDYENKSYNKILLGPYRVNPGKLSVSRTIGDAKAKLEKFGGIPNVIIPEPDVYVFDYYKDNIDYFIMGCDGIFDRLKSCEVFQCANIILDKTRELLDKNNKYNHSFNTTYDKKINMSTTCGNIVDMILRASMLRKSYDNVTCIIIAFKDLLFGNNNFFKVDKEINGKENIKMIEAKKNLRNSSSNVGLHNGHLHKDIIIDKYNNFFDFDNKDLEDDIKNFTYTKISKYNKINNNDNNYLIFDNKNKENDNNTKIKNDNKNNYKNHRRIASQSQEKKIRELISLFSINNKKGKNNENTNILYRSYGSKKELNKELNKDQQNLDFQNDKKNQIIFDKKEKYKNNITIFHDNSQRISATSKNIGNNLENEIIPKKKKITFYKKNNLELRNSENHKNNYSFIKKYNSITNETNNKNINSLILKDSDNFEPPINDTLRSNIKTNEILHGTPNRVDNFSKRITTRKIIRKANNNIFNIRNNFKDTIDNNNHNLTLNNKNNFFYSITISNKDNNNELNKIDKNRKSYNLSIKKNSIKYEQYKNRNLRYYKNVNQENDDQINKIEKEEKDENEEKEEKNNNKNNYRHLLNHSGKYNKYKRLENIILPVSSSVGIIYTKKNNIK